MTVANTRPSRAGWLSLALAVAVTVAACTNQGPPERVTRTPTTAATNGEVVFAVGDIGSCESRGDEQTAELIGSTGTLLVPGDIAYESGTKADFDNCYQPSWGGFKSRTRPAPGNHEYKTAGAADYFDYFGPAAGPAGEGWYSFEIGTWHIIALNSNCKDVGCTPESAQLRWLRADLAKSQAKCTLAFWHHPRFSSGTKHGNNDDVAPLWQAINDGGGDIVLNGHEHNYERFAPLDGRGKPDARRGVREFIVGTGGRSHYQFGPPLAGSENRNASAYGVLRLELRPDSYRWEFLTIPGGRVADSGTASCQ